MYKAVEFVVTVCALLGLAAFVLHFVDSASKDQESYSIMRNVGRGVSFDYNKYSQKDPFQPLPVVPTPPGSFPPANALPTPSPQCQYNNCVAQVHNEVIVPQHLESNDS